MTKLRNMDVIIAREKAHAAFDLLYRTGWMTREQAYEWMSSALKITRREAHVGLLSIEQCHRLYELSLNRIITFANSMRGTIDTLKGERDSLKDQIAKRSVSSAARSGNGEFGGQLP